MTKEDFIKMLDKHDWYYEMSEDHGVYTKGSAEEATILYIAGMYPELQVVLDEYKATKLGE